MIRAASLSIDVNLLSLSQLLQRQGVPHRIVEESGQQVIWVEGEGEAALVRQALADWSANSGNLQADPLLQNAGTLSVGAALLPRRSLVPSLKRAFVASPVTFSLIAACLLVALLSLMGSQPGRVGVLFYPLLAVDNLFALLGELTSVGTILRTLTPMFLHFGELHLIFNMLWLWYFGRQLEAIHPRWLFVVLIILTSFVSNTTQYLSSNFNNFGGMSGVVYGLVGYTWLVHTLMPRSRLEIRGSMFAVFVAALVLMEILASSWIATAAHIGGLFSGLLLGLGVAGFYRLVLKRDHISRSPSS
ncbi:MAG: rhomboid family intramembrane serine protease [Proteobacteria bacterium]|nr:rhomboid family intramembrane serine protease [Pseudomonadota bacterium]